MKVLSIIIAVATLAHLSEAQYFSAGWQPGQSVSTASVSPTSAAYTPAASDAPAAQTPDASAATQQPLQVGPIGQLKKIREDLREKLDPANVLQAKPIAQLFNKAGINITEKVEEAKRKAVLWDDRIPLITDENWGDMIVNETLTEEEEKNRVWFVVISTAALRRGGVNKHVDDSFELCYNLTLEAEDLPDVRFARIDYSSVTTLTTKWAVWRAPQFMIIKDRGQTLYFYKAQHISPKAEQLREFLVEKGYQSHEPWNSAYAPGGDREWIMDFQAQIFKKTYNVTSSLPQWVLAIASGTLASILIRFFHRSDAAAPATATAAAQPPRPVKDNEATTAVTESPSKSLSTAVKTKSPGAKKKGNRR